VATSKAADDSSAGARLNARVSRRLTAKLHKHPSCCAGLRPGASKTFGSLTLELDTAVTAFADNDECFRGHTRKANPVVAVQSHFVYSFPFASWAALDTTYYDGGRSTVDGVRNDAPCPTCASAGRWGGGL
jgi:hypothetical protein